MPFTMSQLPITEAVYTFVDHGHTPTHIAASTLCVMDPGLIAALERGDLGVEEPHALTLPEAALERPGIIGEGGDAHISIDGAHRLWRRWKRGDREFPAYVVPEALWREFTITDMPGTGEFWHDWNRTAQVRTPELEALMRRLEAGDVSALFEIMRITGQ